jgi:hypothetical protein
MNVVAYKLNQPVETGLERVVEPLASYISAARHPKAALRSALAVLRSVVEENNRAAYLHLVQNWEHN